MLSPKTTPDPFPQNATVIHLPRDAHTMGRVQHVKRLRLWQPFGHTHEDVARSPLRQI